MIARHQALSKVSRLPPISETVIQLVPLLHDEDATTADLVRVLQLDPSMSADLLRMTNAGAFCARGEVNSVTQAVNLLGRKRLFEVAMSAAVLKVLPDPLPGYGLDLPNFWGHCVAVGSFAEALAEQVGKPLPDFAFTAGLLHDAGKMVIGQFLEDGLDAILDDLDDTTPFFAGEAALLGMGHDEVGEMIGRAWHLPASIVAVMRWHHHPSECPSPEHQAIVDLVHAADALAHTFGYGADDGGLRRRVEPEVMERLGVKSRTIDAVVVTAIDRIEGLKAQAA